MSGKGEHNQDDPGDTDPDHEIDQIERIRVEVSAMLETGELLPGARLREAKLARRLNIGRNVAREGLRALEQVGIVRFVPNKGAEVRKLAMEEALHLYDVRSALAHGAARLAAKRITKVQLEEMAEMQRQMTHAMQHDDALLYNTINRRFHELVFEGARNMRLSAMNDAVQEELRLFLSNTFYSAAAFARSWNEHQLILEALIAGDEAAAAAAFESHVLEGKARLIDGHVAVKF